MVEIQGRDPVDENTPGLINARALREPRPNCGLFEGCLRNTRARVLAFRKLDIYG